ARQRDIRTVGLDAEPNLPVSDPGVMDLVTLPEERAQLHHLADLEPEIAWDRLIFSAKESVYKAWYPLAHRWLGFEEAHIAIDSMAGTFYAHLLTDPPPGL